MVDIGIVSGRGCPYGDDRGGAVTWPWLEHPPHHCWTIKQGEILKRRAATIAGTAVTILALTATNANAATNWGSKTASVGGGAATCQLTTWAGRVHDDHAQLSCSVKDTRADGEAPYVRWWQDGFGYVEFAHNRKGKGTTVRGTDARQNGSGSFGTVYFKVCRDVSYWPDDCGATKTWDLG